MNDGEWCKAIASFQVKNHPRVLDVLWGLFTTHMMIIQNVNFLTLKLTNIFIQLRHYNNLIHFRFITSESLSILINRTINIILRKISL